MDLDKARAARREAAKIHPEVIFGGEKFELPLEMPYSVVKAMMGLTTLKGQEGVQKATIVNQVMDTIMKNLLGKNIDRFNALTPSYEDLFALMDGLLEEYGINVGELSASVPQLKKSTRRPRRTFKPTTV